MRSCVEVGDDEAARRGGSRGADIGGEVAERRVLLVADRADDRNRAAGDGSHDPLVAEREQVLEAPTASGEDDDVHLRLAADRTQRLDDGEGSARPLDEGLGDDDPRGGNLACTAGDHVTLRGGVVPRHEADASWQPRQQPLPLGGEQALSGELLLQPLERCEVLAETEALDRECAQPQLAARLVAARDGRRRVRARPRGGRDEARRTGGAGISPARTAPPPASFRVKKTLCQRSWRRSSADLALDPDRRQPLQPRGDTAVEGGHRVDLPIAVVDRLDLHAPSVDARLAAGSPCRRRPCPREARGRPPLDQDLDRELRGAAGLDQRDGLVEISAGVGESLGQRHRISRLHQHVEPPCLDLRALVVRLDRLRHLHRPLCFVLT